MKLMLFAALFQYIGLGIFGYCTVFHCMGDALATQGIMDVFALGGRAV
jgi:hypothetical protein